MGFLRDVAAVCLAVLGASIVQAIVTRLVWIARGRPEPKALNPAQIGALQGMIDRHIGHYDRSEGLKRRAKLDSLVADLAELMRLLVRLYGGGQP